MPRRIRFLVLAGTIALTGCADGGGTVTGTVTYNGQPVEQGTISFRPADGMGKILATTIENGTYAIEEAVAGSRTVAIRGTKDFKPQLSSEEAARSAMEAEAAGNKGGVHIGDPADYIPQDAEGNNATVDLSGGDEEINFDLTGPPRN